MTEDIKINRKMLYDERKKILTIIADVENKKEKKHKIETIQYIGKETIKNVADQFKKKKELFKTQIKTYEKEISVMDDQMKELKKLGLNLTTEEQKIKEAVEKINNNIQYENLESKKKGSQDMLEFAKSDLKDTNAGFEELKQKVKNIKLE